MLLPMRSPGTAVTGVAAFLLALSGCGDGNGDAQTTTEPEPAGTSLVVTLDRGDGSAAEEWTLTCEPVGGTHPEPEIACATLDRLDPAVLEPVPPDQMCTQIYGGPQTATIAGTWDGAEVDAAFSRENGCEIDRWDEMADIVGDPGGVQG